MKRFSRITAALIASMTIFMFSCDKDNDDETPKPQLPQANVVKSAGDVLPAINQFRSLIGDSLNTTTGKTSGRREVNWEGVPSNQTNNNLFPLDFFNNTDPNGPVGRKRGLVYSPSSVFRVDSTAYSEIEASYATEFKAFSGKKLFAPAGSNKTEISFRIAGTNTPAFVNGFGLVFSDIDDESKTTVHFYDGNKSLGIFNAPKRTDADGFSFLGVFFPTAKVTRIVITTGNGVLAAGTKDITAGGSQDLVVMDDFFYDEPKVIE